MTGSFGCASLRTNRPPTIRGVFPVSKPPVEVLIRFDLRSYAGTEQPAQAAAILRKLADDFEKNQYRGLIIHNRDLVGNVFLLDEDGKPIPKDQPTA